MGRHDAEGHDIQAPPMICPVSVYHKDSLASMHSVVRDPHAV